MFGMTESRLFRAGYNAVVTLLGETGWRPGIAGKIYISHFPLVVSILLFYIYSICFYTHSFKSWLGHYTLLLLANLHSFGLDVLYCYYGPEYCVVDGSPSSFNLRFLHFRCTCSKHHHNALIGSIERYWHSFCICGCSFCCEQCYLLDSTRSKRNELLRHNPGQCSVSRRTSYTISINAAMLDGGRDATGICRSCRV